MIRSYLSGIINYYKTHGEWKIHLTMTIDDDDDDDDDMMNCYCGMVDLRKTLSLISSWNHC